MTEWEIFDSAMKKAFQQHEKENPYKVKIDSKNKKIIVTTHENEYIYNVNLEKRTIRINDE